MKKVSANLVLAVMCKGICQLLGWFFGLFGYKRDGKFAKCVWGLFATSGAVIMAFFALAIICAGVEVVYEHWFKGHDCDDEYCYHSEYVNRDIYFHNTEDGKGYVYNKRTGEKLIKHIAWIANPLGKDTLVCFSNGKKRGYFSKNTGKVAADEVAQIYLSPADKSQNIRPIQLQGFARVSLKPGESKKISVKMYTEQLGFYTNDGQRQWNIQPGKYIIKIGASSQDIKLQQEINLSGEAVKMPLRKYYFSEAKQI